MKDVFLFFKASAFKWAVYEVVMRIFSDPSKIKS